MDTKHPCIYCGQFVMFADPHVTACGSTICPHCLKKRFPKAANLLENYRRHTQPITRTPIIFSQSIHKRPSSRSD